MTQIIEKLAEMIWNGVADEFNDWDSLSEDERDGVRQSVRAILQHLRDNPTPEMIEAGAKAWFDRVEQVESAESPIAAAFTAILNTALGEE